MNIVFVFVLSVLAGARLYRLFAIDSAGKPLRDLYFKIIPNRYFDLAQEGASCPFCVGFWITSAVFASGLLWADGWGWKLIVGVFAANWVQAQLNAWLDIRPVHESGGEIEMEEIDASGE